MRRITLCHPFTIVRNVLPPTLRFAAGHRVSIRSIYLIEFLFEIIVYDFYFCTFSYICTLKNVIFVCSIVRNVVTSNGYDLPPVTRVSIRSTYLIDFLFEIIVCDFYFCTFSYICTLKNVIFKYEKNRSRSPFTKL